MSDPTQEFGDWLADMKVWLTNHPLLSPLMGGRWFYRIPDEGATAPFGRLYQSGGGVSEEADAPVDMPRLSIEIWHTATSQVAYGAVRQVVAALKSAFRQADTTVLNPSGTTVMESGAVVTVIDSPDPDTGWPRIICDVALVIAATY